MSGPEKSIILENVFLAYGSGKKAEPALRGISAAVANGGITGLMGPDASGKTTLMRVLAGLLTANSGRVEIFGMSAAKLKESQPNAIGYMPQRFGLYEDLSVADNLDLYAALRAVPANERAGIFSRLLKFTGLAPFTARLAGDLSGGMKQKLGIACSLLGQPRLLLLDEPGVGVDPRSRRDLWNMVVELASGGMTVIWATSYLDEAAMCPQLIVLEKGAILFHGKPVDLAETAKGKVYRLECGSGSAERRDALKRWTTFPGIIDVLIQGDAARIEVGGPAAQEAARRILAQNGKAEKPDLGDAYIAAVGGIDKRPSPFSEIGRIGQEKNSDRRIEAKGLTKKFGSFTAAHNISFRVAAGEIMGLLGPNGAGKSTTFRMLCGLSRPSSGECSVDGVDMLRSGSEARSRLGYMAQKFSLYSDISVWQNIAISGRLYGLSGSRIKDFGREMARALDLEPWLKRDTGSLPLGLKQRLALLCATLHEPPVLFLDEPTSGVDLRARRDFWKHISALANAGAAVLVTTHFLEEAEYCDKIALIYRGNMIEFGTPDDLRAKAAGSRDATLEDAFISCIDRYDREHPL